VSHSRFQVRDLASKELGLYRERLSNLTAEERDSKLQWEHFEEYVRHLNQQSPDVAYKVLYIGRHGEGVHNHVEECVSNLGECLFERRLPN